jgi:hypothetical protein
LSKQLYQRSLLYVLGRRDLKENVIFIRILHLLTDAFCEQPFTDWIMAILKPYLMLVIPIQEVVSSNFKQPSPWAIYGFPGASLSIKPLILPQSNPSFKLLLPQWIIVKLGQIPQCLPFGLLLSQVPSRLILMWLCL